MKFGKVAYPEKVDFSFPPIPQATEDYLNLLSTKENKASLYIGATGWSMREWIGSVYPKGIKTNQYLQHYSQQFNTIEFNTTHYRIPTFETVEKWRNDSAADFKFCPKIPQSISHRNDMVIASGQLDLFLEAIASLGEKLGSCFMQLPPYFGPDRMGQLLHFLQHWPIDQFQLCLEFRQEDWFQTDQGLEVFEVLRKKGFGSVITDVAGRRDVLHLQLTAPYTMIRFVGNGLIDSDLNRIDAWNTLLTNWAKNGLETIYFFPHQPDNILAPQACEILGEKFSSNHFQFRFPNLTSSKDSGQMNLF